MRLLAALCLLSLCLSIDCYALPTTPDWQAQLQQGKELLQQKNYRKARQCFERATELQPRSAEAFFFLAISSLHDGDRSAAETALRQAVKLDPTAVSGLYNLGVLLLDEQRPVEAVDYLERARKVDPHNQELAANLIRAELESRQEERALSLVDSASRQFAGEVGFHTVVGKLLLDHGLNRNACTELSVANRLAPQQTEIAIPMGAACLAAGDISTAKSTLKSVEEQSRYIADYHAVAAQASLQEGDPHAALESIKQAVQLAPANPAFLMLLGRVYQKCGQQNEALAALERARSLDRQNVEITYSIAVSYLTLGDEQKASATLESAIEIAPHFDRALFLLGSINLWKERLDDADKLLTKALHLQPGNPFYLCFFGMLRIQQLRPAEAEREFRQAELISPSYALPRFQRGRLLSRAGNYAQAREELEKAISLQPNLAEAYYELALLLRRLGKSDEANQAMARFKSFRTAENSNQEIILKELQERIR